MNMIIQSLGTNTRRTRKAYNKTAKEYAEKTRHLDMSHEREIFLKDMKPRGYILDIGCGWGKDAKIFSDLGYEVTGIDISENMLAIARKTSPTSQFVQSDFRQIPFLEQSFDGLWASASLLHAESKDHVPKILAEWNRVFRTDGKAYIVVKQGDGEEDMEDKRYQGVVKHYCYFQEDEIKDLLKKAGFKQVVTELPKKQDAYYTHPWINIYATK
jgi:ubiquinone/menaquinone biosynthesis C-methylase UbiE